MSGIKLEGPLEVIVSQIESHLNRDHDHYQKVMELLEKVNCEFLYVRSALSSEALARVKAVNEVKENCSSEVQFMYKAVIAVTVEMLISIGIWFFKNHFS